MSPKEPLTIIVGAYHGREKQRAALHEKVRKDNKRAVRLIERERNDAAVVEGLGLSEVSGLFAA